MVGLFSSSKSSSSSASLGSIVRAGVLAVLAVTCITLPASVDAHGFVTQPSPEFTGGMKTGYTATMSPVFSGKFDGSPQHNVDTFTEAFNANKKKYPDLRTLLDGHGTKCGNTNEFASPKPIPSNGVVVFQNPDSGEGFVPSHMGPCEIWLDDTRVFHDDNCAGSFTSQPKAELSVDFSACTGEKCLLQFYWLALHEPTWQVYKNCVPLIGNGGEGNDKVMVANEYSVPSSSSPSSSPSSTEYSESSEYSTPVPSRRKCHSKQGKRSLRR